MMDPHLGTTERRAENSHWRRLLTRFFWLPYALFLPVPMIRTLESLQVFGFAAGSASLTLMAAFLFALLVRRHRDSGFLLAGLIASVPGGYFLFVLLVEAASGKPFHI